MDTAISMWLRVHEYIFIYIALFAHCILWGAHSKPYSQLISRELHLPFIHFVWTRNMCRREGSCSAVRTCTQCFAASYARVTCEFLHGLRLRRRCRTDIYTISRGSSGVLANLIRLKRQIFVCLLPLARCVAVRANVVWHGAYTQYKAMR